jgi:nitrile hydratase accessory protein
MQSLPAQPKDESGPIFNEPWEAQAFALVLALHKAGQFSWSEWTKYLSEEIKLAQQAGDLDFGKTYYQHWLRALEKISLAKGLTTNTDLMDKTDQWRQAYLTTPHGHPIDLN